MAPPERSPLGNISNRTSTMAPPERSPLGNISNRTPLSNTTHTPMSDKLSKSSPLAPRYPVTPTVVSRSDSDSDEDDDNDADDWLDDVQLEQITRLLKRTDDAIEQARTATGEARARASGVDPSASDASTMAATRVNLPATMAATCSPPAHPLERSTPIVRQHSARCATMVMLALTTITIGLLRVGFSGEHELIIERDDPYRMTDLPNDLFANLMCG